MNISSSDTLFASVTLRGREIFNKCLSGVSAVSEVISDLRSDPTVAGLVTLRLRNSTQGWTRTQILYL